jgi:hypothetical protein
MGYYLAPGVCNQPDRDEAIAITTEQLRSDRGSYRIRIAEPMDETAYLDHLTLDVVDRPPGLSCVPDERFVAKGLRPTGRLIAWKQTIEPVRATDLAGHDLTDVLHAWDRRTADDFSRLEGWNGYAEEHGIVLDFGDRFSRLGPGEQLTLCLAGWTEYPFSQTNYAAATAGVDLRLPVLERLRDDGRWTVLEADAGCPAGLSRMTTLDLTGKLTGPRCVLRLRTNLECYWDQGFVAIREAKPELTVTSLPVAKAVLGYRGYTLESSPDGRMPLLYDYATIVPMPLARMSGQLTRYGDVTSLLERDDDQLALIGSGDEVRVDFDGGHVPALPPGWTRSYVLRAVGYCKDADLATATGDTVGPLPWRGMAAYPFGPQGKRPEDPAYRAYLRAFQTRTVAGTPTISSVQEIDPLVDFLKSHYATEIKSGKLLVIGDKTSIAELFFGPASSYRQFVDYLSKQADDQVPAELIDDFCRKNAQLQPVWPELGSRVPMQLFGGKDSVAIFHTDPDAGWTRFYQKYPGAPGIITVSRVGFNGAKNLAMFYVGRTSGSLNGYAQIYVMKKQGDKWVETKIQIGPSWVS